MRLSSLFPEWRVRTPEEKYIDYLAYMIHVYEKMDYRVPKYFREQLKRTEQISKRKNREHNIRSKRISPSRL